MNLYKKGQQRLYFLRKLNALHIYRNILFVFHGSFVKSVMTFGLVCWWGNLSVKNREKLNRIYTISCKIAMCCTPDTSLEQLYKSRTLQMATKILSDPTHFLHDCYKFLPSGRRYRMPTVKTQRAHPPSSIWISHTQNSPWTITFSSAANAMFFLIIFINISYYNIVILF